MPNNVSLDGEGWRAGLAAAQRVDAEEDAEHRERHQRPAGHDTEGADPEVEQRDELAGGADTEGMQPGGGDMSLGDEADPVGDERTEQAAEPQRDRGTRPRPAYDQAERDRGHQPDQHRDEQ